MNYKNLHQEERDKILKTQLKPELVKILDRYRLESTPDLKWVSKKENSHEQVIFTQKFLQNTDEVGAIFRANYLCFAKVNYFRENMYKYEPCKYDPVKGFISTEFSDSDFLKHKATGRYIDYRFLQRITEIEVFVKFCDELENAQT